MYCNNCGHEVAQTDTFCVNCGAPVTAPSAAQQPLQPAAPPPITAPGQVPMPTATYGQPEVMQDRGVYGRFGGLMIYGGLIILLLIAGAVSSGMFLDGRNLINVFRQLITMLPLAFAVGITVKHKGIDISFAAMFALTAGILLSAESLGVGIVIALLACIIVGAINAVGIHFLKLPGLLVTIVTYLIVGYIATFLIRNGAMRPMRIEPTLMYVVALIAAVVAVAAALLSSIGKNHRNKFWSTLVVYAASGILAVLYCLTIMVRVQAVVYSGSENLVTTIVFIALFLGITRFFKSKALGVVFAIIPVMVLVLFNNLFALLGLLAYLQQVILLVFVIIMIFLVMYRGRAQLLGQRLDRMYRAKSWIAMIPLFVILLSGILLAIVLSVTMGRPSQIYFVFSGITADIILFLIAIGISIAYGLMKPKGSTIV